MTLSKVDKSLLAYESKIKGNQYEIEVKEELMKKYERVYRWHEIPISVLKESKLFDSYSKKRQARINYICNNNLINENDDKQNPMSDLGCDILYYNEKKEKWIIVQCKNYLNCVNISDLYGFYFITAVTRLDGEVYYSNKIGPRIGGFNNKYIKYIHLPYSGDNKNKNEDIKEKKEYELRDYQKMALKELKHKRIKQGMKRLILQMPCGTGKTLTASNWAKDFDLVIIFSPLKQLAKQNLESFKEVLTKHKSILVDSDGERDPEIIKEKFEYKLLLSVTYKSADVIADLLDDIKENYENGKIGIIFDEFHNLSRDQLLDKESHIRKIFACDFIFLQMSATPRVFDLNRTDEDAGDLIGEMGYKYSFGIAIENENICDYRIIVNSVRINKEKYLEKIFKEINVEEVENDSNIKASALLRGLDELGYNKCFAYLKDKNDIEEFMEALELMNKYHGLKIHVDSITCDNNDEERRKIFEDFRNFKGISILCNIKILNEGIDIPECDSVFLTGLNQSDITTIQRICRPNRKLKSRPDKIAGYLFLDLKILN